MTSPTVMLLCRTGETSPPSSSLVVRLRLVPVSPEREYWRTWRSPSGRVTLTLTYWPGRAAVTGVSAAGSKVKVMELGPAGVLAATVHGVHILPLACAA